MFEFVVLLVIVLDGLGWAVFDGVCEFDLELVFVIVPELVGVSEGLFVVVAVFESVLVDVALSLGSADGVGEAVGLVEFEDVGVSLVLGVFVFVVVSVLLFVVD